MSIEEVRETKPPTRQELLAPLRQAAIPVAITAFPTFLLNLSILIVSFGSCRHLRLVGWADIVENILAALILSSIGFLIVLIRRTIRGGAWRGLGRSKMIVWSTMLVAMQTIIVLIAETAIFASRDREVLQQASMSDDGRVAYLYSDVEPPLFCSYRNHRLYVAVPFSLLMEQESFYPERSCGDPTPSIDWGTSRSPQLVDSNGKRMAPYSSGGSIFVFH